MPITEKIFLEIRRRVNSKYKQSNSRDFAVQYSVAIQVLIDSFGIQILDIIPQLFPEATKDGIQFEEDFRSFKDDGFVHASHSFTGPNVASSLTRVIFFANAVYVLETNHVRHFERAKVFCTKEGLKRRGFERTYYEIVIAAKFVRVGREVEFVEEEKTRNVFRKRTKTPDLLVLDRSNWVSVECKSNVFKNLDSVSDSNLRTKRAIDKFIEGCNQVQEYGNATGRHGIIFVQYFNNKHIDEDKEDMRSVLIKEMWKYANVEGGGFTYDIFDSRFTNGQTTFFGAVKDPKFFSPGMLRTLSFQNPIEMKEWDRHSFENWPYK